MNAKLSEQIERIKSNKEKIGGYFRESLTAIFFVWCIFIVLFAKPHVISATLGTVIIVAGLLLRIMSSCHPLLTQDSERLEIDGLYKLFRHPVYLANMLLVFGVSVYSRRVLIILLSIAIAAAITYFMAMRDDSFIREKFENGDEYIKGTPSWLPKSFDWLMNPPVKDLGIGIGVQKNAMLGFGALLIFLMLKSL